MNPPNDFDVIVIGGGPAGSAAATLIAQGGHRVLQLERDAEPTFKVGESLIPATFGPLQRLGLIDKLQASNFPKKHSVQFYSSKGGASAPFYFRETESEETAQTWQVLRREFDEMLLQNARDNGVEVRRGTAVQEVLFEGDRAVGVRVKNGGSDELRSRVVIDASGQRAMLARQLKIRRPDPQLRMAAVYTHFEGAQRDQGIDEGATLILRTGEHRAWFWFIPLPDNRVSVGVVGPIDHLIQGRQGDPQGIFDEELRSCPGLVPRLEGARQLFDMKVLNDFSYAATRVAGDGWVLVGDAFCFLDPVYSSGVLLALASAELAADAVLAGLAEDDTTAARLGAFEPYLRRGVAAFRHLVYAFYSPEFHFGRFLHQHPEHRDSIVKILVGDVFERDFESLFRDLDLDLEGELPDLPPHMPMTGSLLEQRV
jgi:flavin-dependent dehydrogenase